MLLDSDKEEDEKLDVLDWVVTVFLLVLFCFHEKMQTIVIRTSTFFNKRPGPIKRPVPLSAHPKIINFK